MGKISKIEHQTRIAICRVLMSGRTNKADIKLLLRTKFGTSSRTAERYMARAREQILADTNKSVEEHRIDALVFYNSIVASREEDGATRIKAQDSIVKLLGLEVNTKGPQAPQVTVNVNTDTNNLTADERRARIIEILDALRERAGAGGAGRVIDAAATAPVDDRNILPAFPDGAAGEVSGFDTP